MDTQAHDVDIPVDASTNYVFINDTLIQYSNISSTDNSSAAASEGFSESQTFLISVTVPLIFAFIFGIGLVGNILVVIVVSSNAQMKSTTNQLITNLAVADLLFIIFCVPFTAWDYATSSWPFGSAWCKICQYLIVVCANASIYTLVLMSLDRFLAVAYPIIAISLRTSKYTHLALAIMWTVIIIICAPTMMMYNLVDADNGTYACRFLVDDYNEATYQWFFFVVSFVIPVAWIFALYIAMLKRLWSNIAPGRNSVKSSENSMRSKRKVTRMVVIVVFIFTICWLPIQFVLLFKSLGFFPMNPSTVILQIFAQVFAYMNSCVNPILYAFLSENFRKGFTRIIARRSDGNCIGGRGTGTDQEMAANGIRKKLATLTTVTTTTTTTTQLNTTNQACLDNNNGTNGKCYSNTTTTAAIIKTTNPSINNNGISITNNDNNNSTTNINGNSNVNNSSCNTSNNNNGSTVPHPTTSSTTPTGSPVRVVETSVQCVLINGTNGSSETTVAHPHINTIRATGNVPFGINQIPRDTLL